MRRALLILLLAIGCKSADPPAPASDAGTEDDDAADALPTLDPKACGAPPAAESIPFDAAFVAKSSGDALADRAFPLFSMLSVDPIASTLRADATVAAIADERAKRLKDCTDCVAAVAWTDAESTATSDAIAAKLDLAAFATDMRASGAFARWSALDDAALFATAFHDEVFAAAQVAADFAKELDAGKLATAVESARTKAGLPFDPTLALALAILRQDGRDEAIRHLDENAEALATIPSIDWAAYPFPLIVVPGLGPTNLDEPLSEGGRSRCDLAADRWSAKLAPLIVVSGGHVHPDRTPYSEAIEMKKYLVSVRNVPSKAILVDPHARHTTTNLRDVARLMLHAKIPVDRPSLLTSDPFQSLYMIGNPFAVRCDNELGIRPFRVLPSSLSMTDSCFFPSKLSLQIDARDPLDP